jgi:hypothetical protein
MVDGALPFGSREQLLQSNYVGRNDGRRTISAMDDGY